MGTAKKIPVRVVDLIVRKRAGQGLTREEIEGLISAYSRSRIPDYQMSALLMAICFQGMSREETTNLTRAMVESGSRLDLCGIDGPKVDKHSTGGVGDKVSIILAPLVAACGLRVPMISGRGLAHTGGTLDKLESIPGFRVGISEKKFLSNLEKIGLVVASQSARLVPADRKLYALRDVTGTVECIPLIVASILSKKIASGIDGLVLDIKLGSGGFSPTPRRARGLARALLETADGWNLPVTAVLTRMEEPLGRAVGNAPEILECISALRGEWDHDLEEVTLTLAEEMLMLGGIAESRKRARASLAEAIAGGHALDRFRRFVKGQGGDPRVASDPGRLPRAKRSWPVCAPRGGFVENIEGYRIGMAAVRLGAGRAEVTDRVDPAVGLWLRKKVGEPVRKGEAIVHLLADSRRDAKAAAELVLEAYRIGKRKKRRPPMILERMYNEHASRIIPGRH